MPNKSAEINEYKTLVSELIKLAALHPDLVIFTFIEPGKKNQTITYKELDIRARAIATNLQTQCKVGERAIILYPPGLELIQAFFGCLYAGVIAIPVYPPTHLTLVEKLQHIIIDSTPSCILSTSKIVKQYKKLKWLKTLKRVPLLKYFIKMNQRIMSLIEWDLDKFPWISTDTIENKEAALWIDPQVNANHVAFLQYTSGSTGHPKGVIISHTNLLDNIKYIAINFKLNQKNSSWLPPYHDMGLIGCILSVLYSKIPSLLMSPYTFLKEPFIWLKTISDYRAEISVAPNFAFDLCVKKITETQRERLDLSCFEICFNGAEPIHEQTLIDFYNTFKSCGLNNNTILPCYGLAESTLIVSCKNRFEKYKVLTISKSALKKHVIKIIPKINSDSTRIVSCGSPLYTVKIVDPHSRQEKHENEIGEVWISGLSVAQGYWNKSEETHYTFHATIKNDNTYTHFLRSGDYGFMHEGELYITGRIKDLIIINGNNYYPQDIEQTTNTAHPAIRIGCCAAFSFNENRTEHLAIVCEIDPTKIENKNYYSLCKIINEEIAKHHDITAREIVLIPKKMLPKTTSGKVKRAFTKKCWENNTLSKYYTLSSHQADKRDVQSFQDLLENRALTIFSKLLKVDIYLDDKFLTSGGDSLISAQLIMEVETHFGVKLDLDMLFGNPSFRELIAIIRENIDKENKTYKKIYITNKSDNTDIPLSYSQEQLWIFFKLHSDLPIYNLPVEIYIKGKLNIELLENAINKLIERHAILRTFFYESSGIPLQKVQQQLTISLAVLDISKLESIEKSRQFNKLIFIEAHQIINLSKLPLLKIKLIKIEQEQYLLLITVPHIIADGRSIKFFINDLSNFYNKSKQEVKPLEFQYADFCLFQRTQKLEENQSEIEFWRNQYTTLPHRFSLPYKNNQQEIVNFEGNSFSIIITKDIAKKIIQLSNRNNATSYMLMLSVLYALISRYTNQTDLIIGSPVSNRSHSEFEELIGYFVNVIPIRISCLPTKTFTELLNLVRKKTLEIFSHQTSLLPSLIPDIYPLIQVMLVWQEKWRPHLKLDHLKTEVKIHSVMAKYELVIEVNPDINHFELKFEYSNELFLESTIKRFAQHFQNVLHQIIDNPDIVIADINYLSVEEKKLIQDWSSTPDSKTEFPLIHEYLEKRASKSPESIAIINRDISIDYAHLNERANRFAYYLRSLHLLPATIIGILLPRSIDFIVALAGILKAGHTCLPLDPTYPAERLNYMIKNSLVHRIVVNKTINIQFNLEDPEQFIFIDEISQEYPSNNLNVPINKRDIAYIIYTSGSTGQPKGVMLDHQGLSSRIQWSIDTIHLNSQDRFLHQFSFNFDAAIASLWWPLASGATLILPSETELMNTVSLSQLIAHYHITTISSIPHIYMTLLDQLDPSNTYIHTFISGGEIFTFELAEKMNKFTPEKIINLYGPTENSIFSTHFQLDTNEIPSIISIGKPIPGVSVYLLDEKLKEVPIGMPGQMYLGGNGLALGYLNHPKLTSEFFIELSGKRFYRTGDLGRYLEDGNIVFMGRSDFQIKISGFRIEPEEIEHALLLHPNVKECAVATVKIHENLSKILAFVVYDNDELSVDKWRNFLTRHLPHHLIPAEFVAVKELPSLPNTKIDRNKIKELAKLYGTQDKNLPETDLEKTIFKIWKQVLNYGNFGINSDFFAVGGSSLHVVKLISMLNKEFHINLSIDMIFPYPTIKKQAEAIQIEQHPTNILIPLTQNKSLPILVCIHPIGGTVFCYQKMAIYLKDKFSIFAIQAPRLSHKNLQPYTINKLAEYYIAELGSQLKNSSYSLLGWSAGGIIAFEMARQLKQKNMNIEHLFLLDTQLIKLNKFIQNSNQQELFKYFIDMLFASQMNGGKFSLLIKNFMFNKILNYEFANIKDFLQNFHISYTERDLKMIERAFKHITNNLINPEQPPYQLEEIIDLLINMRLVPASIDTNALQIYYETFRENCIALDAYDPKPYSEDIIYFQSQSHGKSIMNKWQNLCEKVTIIPVEYHHRDLLFENKSIKTISQYILKGKDFLS